MAEESPDLFTPKPQVESRYNLYVDGSPGAKKDDGKSGWGLVLLVGDTPTYEACGVAIGRATANAMELEAVIQGVGLLLHMRLPTLVTLWTDSRYVAGMLPKLPLLDSNYYTEKGKLVTNAFRLRQLYELYYEMGGRDFCLIRWIKGHAKNAGNERADKLAGLAAYQGQQFSKELY